MPKRKNNSSDLKDLQKLIVLHLAKNNPQTINEAVKIIKHHYRPTWTAFQSLEQKGLIREVRIKRYHRRDFPQFWLTEKGVLAALIEGASPNDLLEKARIIYADNQDLHDLIKIAPKLNRDMLKIGYTAIISKGKLELNDLVMMISYGTKTPEESLDGIREILKENPKRYDLYKKKLEKIYNQLKPLFESFEN